MEKKSRLSGARTREKYTPGTRSWTCFTMALFYTSSWLNISSPSCTKCNKTSTGFCPSSCFAVRSSYCFSSSFINGISFNCSPCSSSCTICIYPGDYSYNCTTFSSTCPSFLRVCVTNDQYTSCNNQVCHLTSDTEYC